MTSPLLLLVLAVAQSIPAAGTMVQCGGVIVRTYEGNFGGTGGDEVYYGMTIGGEPVFAPTSTHSSPDALAGRWTAKQWWFETPVEGGLPDTCAASDRHEAIEGEYAVKVGALGYYTCKFSFEAVFPPQASGEPDPEPITSSWVSWGGGQYLGVNLAALGCVVGNVNFFVDGSVAGANTGWVGYTNGNCLPPIMESGCLSPEAANDEDMVGFHLAFIGAFETLGTAVGDDLEL